MVILSEAIQRNKQVVMVLPAGYHGITAKIALSAAGLLPVDSGSLEPLVLPFSTPVTLITSAPAKPRSTNMSRDLSDVRFLTVAEVAEMMRVSNMTVYRMVHAGEIPAIRFGRSFRIPESAVIEAINPRATDVG
jgi:excisionase family DNA binding protein